MSEPRQQTTVACEGPATMATIEAIRDRLQEALRIAPVVEIDCRSVTEVDVCFLQSLLSARTSALRRGVELRMRQPLAQPLCDALERGGFIAKSGNLRSGQDFWTGES